MIFFKTSVRLKRPLKSIILYLWSDVYLKYSERLYGHVFAKIVNFVNLFFKDRALNNFETKKSENIQICGTNYYQIPEIKGHFLND